MTNTPDKVDGPETPDKVTIPEAAELFRVSKATVRYWLRAYPTRIHAHRKPLDNRIYVSVSEISKVRGAEPQREEEGPANEQEP